MQAAIYLIVGAIILVAVFVGRKPRPPRPPDETVDFFTFYSDDL